MGQMNGAMPPRREEGRQNVFFISFKQKSFAVLE